jgi:hypothetical protein
MTDDEWIRLATAVVKLLDRGVADARKRLHRALIVGTVRARGEKEGGVVEIPASEFANLGVDFGQSRLVPGQRTRWRVTIYAAVEVMLTDIEALAREGEEAAAPVPQRKRRPPLTERLAAELRTMYHDRSPAARPEEIRRDLKARPGVGVFGDTTFKKALRLAFGDSRK